MNKILYVEADPESRRMFRLYLGKAGFHVTLAINLADARREYGPGKFDLVLIDTNVDSVGNTAADYAAELHTDGQLVVINTGDINCECPGVTILHKPILFDTVVEEIKRLIASRSE